MFDKKDPEEEEKVDDDSQLIDSAKGSPRHDQSDTVKATTSPRLNNSEKQSMPPAKAGKSLFDEVSE